MKSTLEEHVARAIYHAAFENQHGGKKPEPGWYWERCGSSQQEFAKEQARAAIKTVEEWREKFD